MITGSCLCGANAFELDREAGPVTACHCGQCRRYSGFHAASVDVDGAPVRWVRQDHVTRYRHHSGAERAFCGLCGTKLWFQGADGWMSLEAGLIDAPSGGEMAGHIFTQFKGDFYEISDGPPQREQG